MSPSPIVHQLRRFCGVLLPFLFAAQLARAVPPPGGIAPLNPPAGGFALDGDVTANTPANVGDWIVCPTPPGTGGGVLDKNGAPLNPATTLHVIDGYGNSGADEIFGGGLKWFDDPNTWRWTMGKCSSKTDINNALLHVTSDAEGHLWAVVSGDRLSTSGDSYIDFEFLQNTLVRRADGSFLSSGPHGGRTTNDLLLSLAFTGGGKTADFFAWRWQPLAGGGFGYVDITTNLPIGRVYVALNAASTAVPYDAFGQTNYDRNAFVEGAVDLTALLSNFDPCMALAVRTVMIKTKASQSSTATIEDFIDPIQFSLTIGPSANAGPDQTRCWEGASTTFALQGQATAGIRPIASMAWSVISGLATLDGDHALNPVVHVSSTSATLRLTVLEQNGCTVTDEVTLNVTPLPPCLISGPAADLCPGSTRVFTGPPGLASYAWTIAGNGTITGPTNGPSVSVLAGGLCGSAFQLQLAVGDNGCASSCSSQFMVNDTTAPTLVLPPDVELECPADPGTNRTGVATAQDGCGHVSVSFHDETTPLCGGSMTITRTWTAADTCGNRTSAVQVITLRDRTPPILTMPSDLVLTCPAQTEPAATGSATARDACSQVSVQHTDDVSHPCGGTMVILRTWTATDACGNTASAVQRITVEDRTAPAMVLPPDRVLECPANLSTNANGVPIVSDACGQVSVRYTDFTTNQCGGSKLVRRTWTATDGCGNSTNAVQTLTVRDSTAPTLVCPADLVLDCPAETGTSATGVATARDGCGEATVAFTDNVSHRCAGTMVITRTWTATDACGNSASDVQMITVQDRTPPVVTAPPHVVLECPAVPATNVTGVATARDLCGGVALVYRDSVSNLCGGTMVIKRTWTATDDCGNSASALQTITVRDTTPPRLTIPPSLVLECPADIQPSATGTATAEDTCGQPTVRYTDAVTAGCGGAKTIRRTWTATDACGNTTSAIQTLTVRDTNPPTIVGPPDRLLECPADTRPSATGLATAQDGCSQTTVSYSDVVTNLCGGSKDIARTWTATDGCGNSVSVVQHIAVRDTRPPEVQCSLVCTYSQGGYGGSGEPAAILEANYLAQFPHGVMVGILDTAGGNAAPNGLFWQPNAAGLAAVREFLSGGGGTSGLLSRDAVNPTDDFGGGELAHQALTLTFNIKFNESGVIGVGPNNFGSLVYTQPNDSLSGRTVSEILLAANRALAGQGLPAGYSVSGLTALLDTLNHSFHEYSVSGWSLTHLDAPALAVQCASSVPAPDPSHVNASDDCSGGVTLFHLSDVISDYLCANHYTITRTWGARDACGNVGTCSFRILVNDTTPPVMTGNASLSLPGGQAWDFQVPIASDNCGSVTLREFSTVTNLVSDVLLVATRAWEAMDECANASYFQQTVTVGGTAAPAGTAGTPVVDSTFETGDEGWLVTDGTTDQLPVVLPNGGQAGAYVKPGNGEPGGSRRFWSAPGKYRGGRLPFYGGFFSFACRPVGSGAPTTLRLVGAGIVIFLDLPTPAGTNWVTCTVRLHESAGWRNAAANRPATQAELIMVLSSLTNLLLSVDVAPDGTVGGLDNVALITPVTAPNSGWILEVQRRGSGIQIRWPSLANGHRLEQADSAFSQTWTPVSATPSVVTGLNQVDLTPVGAKFFRLRKP